MRPLLQASPNGRSTTVQLSRHVMETQATRLESISSCVIHSDHGRPKRLPRALATANPALTRSRIISRSSCAIAPIMVNMAWPIGVDVSNCSCSEMNCTLRDRKSSSAFIRCFTDRANRSNRQTTTACIVPAQAAFISRSRAGVSPWLLNTPDR